MAQTSLALALYYQVLVKKKPSQVRLVKLMRCRERFDSWKALLEQRGQLKYFHSNHWEIKQFVETPWQQASGCKSECTRIMHQSNYYYCSSIFQTFKLNNYQIKK